MSEVDANVDVVRVDANKDRFTGRVKWFNNNVGYGFITACEGEFKDKDIFVHYSSIRVPDDQYKYLVQGEYVDFEISKSDKDKYEFHAMNVSGVKGGNLMCETRKQTNETNPHKPRVYKTPDETDKTSRKKKGPNKQKRNTDDGFTKVTSRRQVNNAKK